MLAIYRSSGRHFALAWTLDLSVSTWYLAAFGFSDTIMTIRGHRRVALQIILS
jgi:hypothetical protein